MAAEEKHGGMSPALMVSGTPAQHSLLLYRGEPVAGWRLRVGTPPWRGVGGKVWPEPLEPGLQLEGRSLQVAALGRLPAGTGPGGWAGSQASRDPGVSFGTMGQALSLITRGCVQWRSHSPLCEELWEPGTTLQLPTQEQAGLWPRQQTPALSWHCMVERRDGHSSSSLLPLPFLMGFHKCQALRRQQQGTSVQGPWSLGGSQGGYEGAVTYLKHLRSWLLGKSLEEYKSRVGRWEGKLGYNNQEPTRLGWQGERSSSPQNSTYKDMCCELMGLCSCKLKPQSLTRDSRKEVKEGPGCGVSPQLWSWCCV